MQVHSREWSKLIAFYMFSNNFFELRSQEMSGLDSFQDAFITHLFPSSEWVSAGVCMCVSECFSMCVLCECQLVCVRRVI